MHLTLISVGKARPGPETALVEDYGARFAKAARPLGFRSLTLVDVESGGGLAAEGARLLAKVPGGARVMRLDEHGNQMPSLAFAAHLARLRDQGVGDLAFLIGGADGFSQAVRAAAPETLAFGPQTWPHRLVKAMLTEQIYRAACILAGSPYHKA